MLYNLIAIPHIEGYGIVCGHYCDIIGYENINKESRLYVAYPGRST